MTSYLVEITVGKHAPVTQRLAFKSMARAKKQLSLLEEKLGKRFSNDPEQARHKVVGDDGELVVVCDEVLSVRTIDNAAFNELLAYASEHSHRENRRMAQHIADAMFQAKQTFEAAS